jgi:hypothetical protein
MGTQRCVLGVTVAINGVDDAAVPGPGGSCRLGVELTERRGRLAVLAERICRSRSLQDEIAARSYWHPNGFVKLVLEERPGWGQVRLHVWPEPSDDDDVHDHAWYYQSVVIGGRLREVVYREVGSDQPGEEMWRHSYGMTAHRRFTLSDPVPVRIVAEPRARDYEAGARSGGGPEHVHRFFAVDAPAVTMLRVGPILVPCSQVYRPESAPQPVLVPRPTSRADVGRWVDHVRGLAALAPA